MAPSVYKNKFTRRCRRGRDAAWTSRPSPRTLPFSEGAPEVLVRAWRLGSLLKDSGVPSHAELRALGGAAQVAASALATCPPPARVPGGGGGAGPQHGRGRAGRGLLAGERWPFRVWQNCPGAASGPHPWNGPWVGLCQQRTAVALEFQVGLRAGPEVTGLGPGRSPSWRPMGDWCLGAWAPCPGVPAGLPFPSACSRGPTQGQLPK